MSVTTARFAKCILILGTIASSGTRFPGARSIRDHVEACLGSDQSRLEFPREVIYNSYCERIYSSPVIIFLAPRDPPVT